MATDLTGIFYQFIALQFAIQISVDWRCADGHLIHLRTLQYDNQDPKLIWG